MKIALRLVPIGTCAAILGGLLLHGTAVIGNSPPMADPMPGRPVYEGACSRCHGPEGRSDAAPVLVPFLWSYSQALDIVRHGGACGMPAFTESQLSDEELKQIVDYLKTLN